MNDYSIEQGYQANCKHDDDLWLIDDVEPPMIICSLCGAVMDITIRITGTHTSTASKTVYVIWS